MSILADPEAFAERWKATCNSHDLDRIAALYSDDVIFKSPRVMAFLGEASGVLRGRAAVREYWRKILSARPDLEFAVGSIFAGVDSIALEYRVGEHLRGIEFMTLDAEGRISFAAGNDAVRPASGA